MLPISKAASASILLLATGLSIIGDRAVASPSDDSEPVVQTTKSGGALKALGSKPLEQRVAVTIYEFHSGVPNVSVTAATDIFTTALIESGQFRVVERQRLAQGVVAEKQMNAAGQTTGDVAQKQLRGARYIFEGTVSEANAGETQRQGGINIGGLNLGGGKNKDTIAVDVRILDAETGDVLDSVSVSKVLNDSSAGVSGTAAFVGTLASMRGAVANPLTPDVSYQSTHQESVDKALRACIETSVLALIKRVDPKPSTAASGTP
jgi:curli biogenesis system outer membrane secretion channel CsgG